MNTKPILFQGAMVRALLDGSKTQTRRIMKPQPIPDAKFSGGYCIPPTKRTEGATLSVEAPYVGLACPYGQTGDRLWVREAWTTHKFMDAIPPRDLQTISIAYVADGKIKTGKYRQGFHMPRRYSRITLEITGVRVERLQDISEADAKAEGLRRYREKGIAPDLYGNGITDGFIFPIDAYSALWEQINGLGSWDANPWVWVVEFKRV